MRSRKIFQTYLIFLMIFGGCFAQEIVEDENWLKGFRTEADSLPSLIYPFTKFTQEDLTKAKQRLKNVRQFTPKNEWEGIYYSNTGIGSSKLIWNEEGGLFEFYFYHYLKYLNYGPVKVSSDFVEVVSEKPSVSTSGKKQATKTKLIKVKFGEKHFLIPEIRLKDFCERVAGVSTDFDDSYYWIKEEDMEMKVFGLPILPSRYKPLLRYPIEAQIISVGKGKIIPSEYTTKEVNYDEIRCPVTLDAGKNKKIKKGMIFFVEELDEWIEITKAFPTKSIGFISRYFDENNGEQNRGSEGGMGQLIPCKEIKVRMKSKTTINEMYF